MDLMAEEKIPAGILKVDVCSIDATPNQNVSLKDIWVEGAEIPAVQDQFSVNPKHQWLFDAKGIQIGAKFNVETVAEAISNHRKKAVLKRHDILKGLANIASSFYAKEEQQQQDASNINLDWENDANYCHDRLPPPSIHLEAVSLTEPSRHEGGADSPPLVYVGGNGFLVAAVTAFAQHLPLRLSPDHIWLLIVHAFARHVNENSEALRSNFVEQRKSKKQLIVIAPDSFRPASAVEWESAVFPDISRQVKEHIGFNVHEAIFQNFSTTTEVSQICHETVLMSTVQKCFDFGMKTLCGIPEVTLLGTMEDWSNLREGAEKLGELMTPNFRKYWMPLLLPVLDKFVNSYRGDVDHGFWQSMVKLRGTHGSGEYSFISGWMQIFFPYLASGHLSTTLRPWNEMYFRGPEPESFPDILASVHMNWECCSENFEFTFHSGLTGCGQDKETGTLEPISMWFVSHYPTSSSTSGLSDTVKEPETNAKANSQKPEPWFRRLKKFPTRRNYGQ